PRGRQPSLRTSGRRVAALRRRALAVRPVALAVRLVAPPRISRRSGRDPACDRRPPRTPHAALCLDREAPYMKRVLVLGAGLVSRPLVAHWTPWPDIALTVGDIDPAKAAQILGGRGRAVTVSMGDDATVAALVAEADLVVSLLPYSLHVKVAKVAIA